MKLGRVKIDVRCWKRKWDSSVISFQISGVGNWFFGCLFRRLGRINQKVSSVTSYFNFSPRTAQLQNGFTLVEMVIVSAVVMLVGGLVIGIIVNNTGFTKSQSSAINSSVSLNNVMSQIQNDIRESAAVASGYPTVNPTYQSSATILVLKLASLNSNGVIDNVFDYIVYTPDAQNAKILHRIVYADAQSTRTSSDQVLTTILDDIQYDFLDRNNAAITATSAVNIKVTISMLDKTGSIGSSKSATSVTTLRNML
jgi:type II secretory pathway pseudopilin PulG